MNNRNSRYRSNPASYVTPGFWFSHLRAPTRSQRSSLACTERASDRFGCSNVTPLTGSGTDPVVSPS